MYVIIVVLYRNGPEYFTEYFEFPLTTVPRPETQVPSWGGPDGRVMSLFSASLPREFLCLGSTQKCSVVICFVDFCGFYQFFVNMLVCF